MDELLVMAAWDLLSKQKERDGTADMKGLVHDLSENNSQWQRSIFEMQLFSVISCANQRT